jgi:hypothetical protein
MKAFKRIFIFAFVALLLILEANVLVAQGPYSTLTGTVLGIRAKMWLDVKSEKDEAVFNFRIGRKTVYIPHRYPYMGEKVKVEYLTNRGVPVAYTVTILGGQKEEGTKENKK